MPDPHVVSLRYRLVTDGTVSFVNAPTVLVKEIGFRAELSHDLLTIEMIDHYASESAAHQAIEPFLRNWEVWSLLGPEQITIHFTFESAEMIDREPRPPGSGSVMLSSLAVTATGGVLKPELHLERDHFPQPPAATEFAVIPDVETMLNRFQQYQQGKDPLPDAANFCLTLVEKRLGGGSKSPRKTAAVNLGIEPKILSELGRLAATVGGPEEGRKFTQNGPLGHQERAWLEATVKTLIRRLAESAAHSGAGWSSTLTMKDLPPL